MAERKPEGANIKVLGIGGGGVNSINRMVSAGLKNVEFWALNTDKQALDVCLSDNVIQIGEKLTKGLGSGADPQRGKQAADESKEKLAEALKGADMVFITAGMGGGTGTGASPVLADIAKSMGILVIGVVTKPFRFEGPVRMAHAEEGIDLLRQKVDALITIPNDKLLQVVDKNTTMVDAFKVADDVLRQGVQGIADMITVPGYINLDFADIKAIMTNAGSAMMGMGRGKGENRALIAAEAAISSPLLEETITGATGVIFNITGGSDLTMPEIQEAADFIYNSVDPNAQIIFGTAINEEMQGEVCITVIATGFKPATQHFSLKQPTREVVRPRIEVDEEIESRVLPEKESARPRVGVLSQMVEEYDIPAFVRNR